MTHIFGRIAAIFALALGALVAAVPTASAAQDLQVELYFDLDGDGVKDTKETTRPPSSFHPVSSGWSATIRLYKVADNNMILRESWVPVNYGTTPISTKLSPGKWVAVLGHVGKGDINQAPPSWEHGYLTQTEPKYHQSISFEVTANGPTQTVRFGYGVPELTPAHPAPINGPTFLAKADENYNQTADVNEPDVPDGVKFELTAVHLSGNAQHTATSNNGKVTFGVDGHHGARVFAVEYGQAAPPPASWFDWSYSESAPLSIRYLVHNDVNEGCDTDPNDGIDKSCIYWGIPESFTTAAVLAARTPLTGTVFIDDDADGVKDPAEQLASASNNLELEFLGPQEYPESVPPNEFRWEPSPVEVGAGGAFNLGSVPKGNYVLRVPGDRMQVTTGPIAVPSTGAVVSPLEVGVAPFHFKGRAFVDTNGNLAKDPTEQALAGLTLQTYSYQNESQETVDEVITDANGYYRIQASRGYPRIKVVSGLPAEFSDQDDFWPLLTDTPGDFDFDLRFIPVGVPGGVDPVLNRFGPGSDYRVWWDNPTDFGDAPPLGFVVRDWDLDDYEQPVMLLRERCYTPESMFVLGDNVGDFTSVQVVNQFGTGPLSAFPSTAPDDLADGDDPVVVDCETMLKPKLPAAPVNLRATLRDRAVQLAFSPGTVNNDFTQATGFLIDRRVGSGSWSQVATASASARSVTVSGLTVRTKYQFRIRARNAQGVSSPSAAVTITAQAKPVAPVSVKATALRRAVRISFKPGTLTASTGAADRFLVQRKVGSSWRTVKTLGRSSRSATVSSLPAGKRVYFRVVAVNAVGSTPSRTVSAKPKR